MKKVLVTGASGFIGSNIVEYLLEHDFKVIATSSNYNRSFDIENDSHEIDIFNFFECPDLIIHCAWKNIKNVMNISHIDKTLFMHFSFLKNLIRNGLKDVTILGSCFEYGVLNGCMSETTETKPNTPYSIAKNTLRIFLECLLCDYSFSLKWIRPFYVYGKNQNDKTLIGGLNKAITNNDKIFNMSQGDQIRDYLRVEDMAKYIVSIAIQNQVLGIFNCSSNSPISVKNFIENYLKEIDYHNITLNLGFYSYPQYEPLAFWGDNTKMLSII
jgi:nucleoside-diphosphate-sugar epimerase